MSISTEHDKSAAQATAHEASAKPAPVGCCGGAAPRGADACCALDAEVKSTGGSGCGCASKRPGATTKTTKKGCC